MKLDNYINKSSLKTHGNDSDADSSMKQRPGDTNKQAELEEVEEDVLKY